jgi:hypothetical protein
MADVWCKVIPEPPLGHRGAAGEVKLRAESLSNVEPTPPGDVVATLYHLLGIDPHRTVNDRPADPGPPGRRADRGRHRLTFQAARPSRCKLPLER